MAVALATPRPTPSFTITIIIIITIAIFPMTTYSLSEAEALLRLKNSFSNTAALDTWVANSLPCNEGFQWEGVVCYKGFVTGLRLGGLGLSGKIDVDALLELKALRTISLMKNSFTGSIPQLNKIGFLKAVYLSGNKFSGDIPMDYFQRMRSLKKVWLSNNEFTGQIPPSLAEIPQLFELHLENNHFSGTIPNLTNPSLKDLNVSNNKLEGEIPPNLMRFQESSFAGNSGLCGEKFGKVCEEKNPPPIDDEQSNNDNAEKKNPPPIVDEQIKNNVHVVEKPTTNGHNGNSLQVAGIILTSVILVLLLVFVVVRSGRKKDEKNVDLLVKHNNSNNNNNEEAVEVQVTAPVVKRGVVGNTSVKKMSSGRRGASGKSGGGVGELVIVNDEKGTFGLPDLMKASAEVLGNGGFGSSYKAVMANGVAVVVKRTRDMNLFGKDGFGAHMKKIGSLKHWNILTPLGYHYRKDEKLVISEYVPGGSLLYVLHGDRGQSHAELDWPARLKIIKGIAKGMHYLHTELASNDLPHGNLKSSNVLLGPNYEPLLGDYGFSNLINPKTATQTLFAYKAPEASTQGKVSHSCDVYCFGVVILEILTGKFPSQYLNNGKGGTDVVEWATSAVSEGRESELLDPEIARSKNHLGEMVKLIHVGAACTESHPQKRLHMMEAIRKIEEIQGDCGNESRTIEVLPSLRDGYADTHVIVNSEGEESRRRYASSSFGSQEYFEFGAHD